MLTITVQDENGGQSVYKLDSDAFTVIEGLFDMFPALTPIEEE